MEVGEQPNTVVRSLNRNFWLYNLPNTSVRNNYDVKANLAYLRKPLPRGLSSRENSDSNLNFRL